MELRNCPDFETVLKRFDAFWRREILDRPPATVHVDSERTGKWPQKKHATQRERWLDVEYQVACVEAGFEHAVFAGEHFPAYHPNVGPDICATLWGAELEFAPDTSWAKPCLKSCAELLGRKPNYENVYWQTLRRLTDLSLERGRGKWITGVPDLHTNADALSALLNPEELCVEIAEDAATVAKACDHVTRFFPQMYEDFWKRIEAAGQACTSWTRIPFRGRYYNVQCDFICMISPKMAEQVVFPYLTAEVHYLERSIYHLDGPMALKHLDRLLQIPELGAIQWVYGAGQGPSSKWVDVYRRIQAGGKSLQLIADDLNDAQRVAEQIKPQGVWLTPGGSYTRAEAEDFLKWLARWAAKKGR